MKPFDSVLEEEVKAYTGPHADLITQSFDLFRMMTGLLGDKDLPRKGRPLVTSAISYFVLPYDLIPEAHHGPEGYADDIYVCAVIANRVSLLHGSDEILDRHWVGEGKARSVIDTIIGRERDLIGNRRKKLLYYVGIKEE